MKEKLVKCMLSLVTAVLCWLMLSYMFFPIKLAAPPEVYFAENMAHMAPLKAAITLIFILLAVFLYEQVKRKGEKAKISEKS